MVDSTRKKRSDGHPFLPERHLTILVGLLVLLILVFSFIILGISVNQIVNGTVDALNTQAETVAEQTVDLFDNYSRLCETLTANQNLKDFAAYSGQESEETLIVAGYPLRKDLNSLVALYGDDINTLAVYFPGNGSVITMARQVNKADAHLFLTRILLCPPHHSKPFRREKTGLCIFLTRTTITATLYGVYPIPV